VSHLLLGPIVGHTDSSSAIVWIRVRDDPADYDLRVHGRGVFPFTSTEPQSGKPEFGTAIAKADGLRSDWDYRYQILRRSRVVSASSGRFRTMPAPGSPADMLFVSVSCSANDDLGAWPLLARYIESARPRFLILMGDQIYVDDDDPVAPAVWPNQLTTASSTRRQAIAAKYQENWSREPVRTILATIPTYMMWDDHEIRNGWGSFAPDSPTLAAQIPRGAKIGDQYNAYFEDCRDLYWHFQACRNPPPPAALEIPPSGIRRGLPFFFQCGRLFVLVLDDRGARDVWRVSQPVLGDEQWKFLTDALGDLSPDIDAIALVVPLPLSSMSPHGVAQSLYGDRTDDIELFKKGDRQGLLDLLTHSGTGLGEIAATAAGAIFGANIGTFKLNDLTDVRDNWAHHYCRAEQAALIRTVAKARLTNRLASQPRNLVLIGGDLHAGGLFDLTVSVTDPEFTAPSLVTSGIGKQTSAGEGIVGLLMDEDFDIADGIHAKLQKFAHPYNFGVTQILFGGTMAVMVNAVAHEGDQSYWTLRLPYGQGG
jgi:PhoD-like phosphatase